MRYLVLRFQVEVFGNTRGVDNGTRATRDHSALHVHLLLVVHKQGVGTGGVDAGVDKVGGVGHVAASVDERIKAPKSTLHLLRNYGWLKNIIRLKLI